MQRKCPSRSTLKPTREETAKKIEAEEKARKKNQNNLQIIAVEENRRRINTTFKPPNLHDYQNAADSMTIDQILADYDDLEREDILAALSYAARLTHVKSMGRLAA